MPTPTPTPTPSPFVPRRLLMVAHALPQPDQPRLWRWTEAAQSFGELDLIAPAGPHLHLERWRTLTTRVNRLSLQPGTPLRCPHRYRRQAEAWMKEHPYDAVICSAPALIKLLDADRIPHRFVDNLGVAAPSPLTGVLARVRPQAAVPEGWSILVPGEDPMLTLTRRLSRRAQAA